MRGCFLLLTAILLFFPANAFAQFCPIEKVPTETQIYVDRNLASGVAQVTATLTAIDLATKATSPLPKETMWFQECAIGNFSLGCPSYAHTCGGAPQDYWECESTCCMAHQSKPTDADGKSSVLFPLMENTTYIAVYLGGDAYQPSNSTGSFLYPPMLGALDISACFPLFLVLGLLMLSMSAMGRSPIGAFDFSSLRAPRAKQRAPTAYVVSSASIVKMAKGVKKGIEYNKEKKKEDRLKNRIANAETQEEKNYLKTQLFFLQIKHAAKVDSGKDAESLKKDILDTFQGKSDGKGGKKDVLDRVLDVADAKWAKDIGRKTGGTKNLFKVFGKVGKGIGWVADKQLRVMTAGTIGATGGKVPLVKLVGSGVKLAGKGLKKVDQKLGHVPSFVGVGAYFVGKNALEGAKIATGKSDKVRFLGTKIFGLNFGLGFGGGQADYLQYAYDPTGLTKKALVANKNSNSLKNNEIVKQGHQNILDINRDYEGRKKLLNPYVIMGTGSNGTTEVSLTKEGKERFELKKLKRAGEPEIFTLKPLKGADEKTNRLASYFNGDSSQLGTKGLGFKALFELSGLAKEASDEKNNVRTSADANGATFGWMAAGFALPKTGRIRVEDNNFVVDAPESGVKIPLLGVRIPDLLVTGAFEAVNVAGVIKSSSYPMRFGKIEQVGAMPSGESFQGGYSDVTHGARSAAAEERKSEAMNDIMTKDFTKLTSNEMNFLVMNAPPEVVQSLIEKNQTLPIRNSGLSLSDNTLNVIKEQILSKERRGFSAGDFRENRYTLTENGKTLDGNIADIIKRDSNFQQEVDERANGWEQTHGPLSVEQRYNLEENLAHEKTDMILAYANAKTDGTDAMNQVKEQYERGWAGQDFVEDKTSKAAFEKGPSKLGALGIPGTKTIGEAADAYMARDSQQYERINKLFSSMEKENEINARVRSIQRLTGGSEVIAEERAALHQVEIQQARINEDIKRVEEKAKRLLEGLPLNENKVNTEELIQMKQEFHSNLREIIGLKNDLSAANNEADYLARECQEINWRNAENNRAGIGNASQGGVKEVYKEAKEKEGESAKDIYGLSGHSNLMENLEENLAQDRLAEIRKRKYGEDNWDYG